MQYFLRDAHSHRTPLPVHFYPPHRERNLPTASMTSSSLTGRGIFLSACLRAGIFFVAFPLARAVLKNDLIMIIECFFFLWRGLLSEIFFFFVGTFSLVNTINKTLRAVLEVRAYDYDFRWHYIK
jgi:hypothetical protein